ncbi:MAG: DUF1844 domain-containing protein [Candidatus Polarisedimenticolia bacterium]
MPDKEKKEPIKVTDRRAFTPEGERRSPTTDDTPSSPEPSSASTVKGEGFELRRPASSAPQASQQAVDFSSFILSLTSTAFIHLGEMEDPVTHKVQVQLEAARQMIDIIDMLHEKTKGNLDPQEEEFISGILFELKMRYSQRAGTR